MADHFIPSDHSSEFKIGTSKTTPMLFIQAPNASMMVTISYDGTITYGPDYKPDAAAKIFWEAIGDAAPMARIARLEADNAELQRRLDNLDAFLDADPSQEAPF